MIAKARQSKQKPKVYSYIRFSTPEQAMGDSERRQFDAAQAWAKREGLELDTSLKPDRGLSGYHGANRKKGTLGAFLASVEAGAVPTGSILLVENIDRLSREGFTETLRNIIFKLWDKGITLVTLSPEERYPPGSGNDVKFIALMIFMQRAFNESQTKSERIRAAREVSRRRAREEKRPVTRMCPEWLRLVNGKYEEIPAAVATVRMIFDLKRSGKSQREIESHLNKVAPWKPHARKKSDREAGKEGNGWRTSYIKKILSNPAVIGEYQPHQRVKVKVEGQPNDEQTKVVRQPIGEPIADYYPKIIPDRVFFAVQRQLEGGRGKGGRNGKHSNLFRHLVHCAYCGGVMRYVDKCKPEHEAGREWRYLQCDFGNRKVKCKPHAINYVEFESTILDSCAGLKPEQVLPSSTEKEQICKTLREHIYSHEAELTANENQIHNFLDQIGTTDSATIRQRYEDKIKRLDIRNAELKEHLANAESELSKAETGLKEFRSWTQSLKGLKDAIADDPEMRLRARRHLAEFIERIDVFAVGHGEPCQCQTEAPPPKPAKNGRVRHVPHDDHDGDEYDGDEWTQWAMALAAEHPIIEKKDAKTFRAFVAHIAKQRKDRHGRFYRVRFTNGKTFDIAPPESLAFGQAFTDDMFGGYKEGVIAEDRRKEGWRFTSPDLDKLWKRYIKRNGRSK